MQCSVTLESDCNGGNNKMKTVHNYKSPYKKSNLDTIVDQLCVQLQDIKDQEGESGVGMPTCSFEETDAVRRYYAAFPPLAKGRESPLPYYLPPPAWCRKSAHKNNIKMQSQLTGSKDWNAKSRKFSNGKARRNSYQAPRKNNRKRTNSYKSFESEEKLPEWVTHEGVWDLETQNPVMEFIRAIARDEGYGTCENTVTDDVREIIRAPPESMVPQWDDGPDLAAQWLFPDDLKPKVRTPMEEELYARFEAKFDRSIEALWAKDQNTPIDEYQDLPIDFQDLLSSPSDRLFAVPSANRCGLISLTESIWAVDPPAPAPPRASPALHDRLRPLRLGEPPAPLPTLNTFAPYGEHELYDALAVVAQTMHSYAELNHSRCCSGFVEVPPRRGAAPRPLSPPRDPAPPAPELPREDLLTSTRTHFRPIRRDADAEPPRHADGATFDIDGDLDPVEYRRSESGGEYLGAGTERYLEYRPAGGIDYGRLQLTAAQRCPDLEEPGLRLRFPLRQRDAGVQTEATGGLSSPGEGWRACEECSAAKRMRAGTARSIWSVRACSCGRWDAGPVTPAPPPPADELSRDWEELLSDISLAHAQYAEGAAAGGEGGEGEGDRKRRHSAALRCAATCTHPHARFLPCCPPTDRPLTR